VTGIEHNRCSKLVVVSADRLARTDDVESSLTELSVENMRDLSLSMGV